MTDGLLMEYSKISLSLKC